MDKITDRQEKVLLKAAQDIISGYTSGNETLKGAIVKVATANDLTPDMLGRVVEAVNVALTRDHLNKSAGAARADSFDVAHPAEIAREMFTGLSDPVVMKAASISAPVYNESRVFKGEQPEASVGKEYTPEVSRESLEKAANDLMTRAVSALETEKQAAHRHKDKLCGSVRAIEQYFTKVYREPFADVEASVIGKFGSAGKLLMDTIWNGISGTLPKTEKRASEGVTREVNWDADPYFMVEDAVEHTREFIGHLKQAQDILAQIKEGGSRLHGFFTKKGVSWLSAVEAPLHLRHMLVQNSLADAAERESSAKEMVDSRGRIREDFGHMQDLTQSLGVLSDIMAEDEIVSKADPEKVVNLYSDIVSYAPSTAQNKAVMTAALRQGLEYGSDVMGIRNMVDTDTALFKRNILGPTHLSGIGSPEGAPKVSL